MQKHHSQGLCFTDHLGMWGDIPLTLLLAIIVALCGKQWTHDALKIAFVAGIVLSAILHWSYTKSDFPEAHVRNHKLTGPGWAHFVYMIGAFTILAPFYFSTVHAEKVFVIGTSIFLGVHVFCATHVPLSFRNLKRFPEKPYKNPTTWITIVAAWCFLAWRTYVMTR